MTTVFPMEYVRAQSASSLARREVESGGHVVTGLLTREWATTQAIARAAGIKPRRARKLLDRLPRRIVEQTIRGDGAYLWRLSPEFADRLVRERGRR